jgi:hypothetical protein
VFLSVTTEVTFLLFLKAPVEITVLYELVLYITLFVNVPIQALTEAPVLKTLFLNVTIRVVLVFLIQLGFLLQIELAFLFLEEAPVVFVLSLLTQLLLLFYLLQTFLLFQFCVTTLTATSFRQQTEYVSRKRGEPPRNGGRWPHELRLLYCHDPLDLHVSIPF